MKRGDVVAVVETQKGAIEIEIFNDGVVSELVVPVGDRVPVGTVLAQIDGGVPRPRRRHNGGARPAAPAPPAPAVVLPPMHLLRLRRGALLSPAARRLAGERGVDSATHRHRSRRRDYARRC